MPVVNPFLQPVKSAADYSNDYLAADTRRQQNQLSGLQLQQAAEAETERTALRSYLGSGADLTSADGIARGYAAAPTQFGPIAKSFQDRATSAALAQKDIAQAGNFDADSADKRQITGKRTADQAIADTANFRTPQDALTSLNAHFQRGDIDALKYEMVRKTLEPSLQDPSQFPGWKHTTIINIQDAVDRAKSQAPKVDMVNAGGAMVPTQSNLDAGPVGPVAGSAPIPVTQTADNAATQATLRANNAATQAGENARSAAAQRGENLRAGYTEDGKPTADMETTAQAIASGQLPPPAGMALTNPKNQRILARVMEINPQYDYTSVTAKKAAANQFAFGPLGNQMRSGATAIDHLSQMKTLVSALDNGDNNTYNQVKNAVGAWSGGTAPTNLDAAKQVIMDEVMKSIVAGGGGETERKALQDTMKDKHSAAQLNGAIDQFLGLMKPQQANLLAQRRAAGLPDSTLPDYGGGGGGGLPSADAIKAELLRRGGR